VWLSVMALMWSKRPSISRLMGLVSPCSILSACCKQQQQRTSQQGLS
jgi:hypothetical protein